MNAVCPFSRISWMVCLRTIRWSTVAQPLFSLACAFVIWTSCFTLSLVILSYTLPTLLASVIPLSLEQFPASETSGGY